MNKYYDFEIRVQERAYYMSQNGEYNSDKERYLKAIEIESDIKEKERKHIEYEKKLEYYNDILTNDQKEALKLVNQTCSNRHQLTLKRYKETYTEDKPDKIVELIKNKSENIEIHINVPYRYVINIADDTHYRNQFETHVSMGTLSNEKRIEWEKNLFRYNNDITGPDRPKYGNLPIQISSGDTHNKITIGYGKCYFTLKNHVKNRTTITHGDSHSKELREVFNFEYFHLIGEKNIQNIKYFVNNGKIHDNFEYIEAQIHGPIRLDTDIAKFCYPHCYHDNLEDSIKKLENKGIKCSSF